MRRTASARPVIALDLDEVCFPFAQEYARWRGREGLVGFDPSRLHTYNFALATSTEPEIEAQEATAFLADPHTLALPPLPGAPVGLATLAGAADIVLLTARYRDTQAESTRAWVEAHLPGLAAEIVHTRDSLHDLPQLKSDLASSLGAVILVDDQPAHLLSLPDTCTGVLFGSYPWQHPALLDPTAPDEDAPGSDLPELVLSTDAPVIDLGVLPPDVLRAPSWSALTALTTTGALRDLLHARHAR